MNDRWNNLLAPLVRAPILLVASDFDGVLADIVPRPDDAMFDPAAKRALSRLGSLPRTYVGIVSGRALDDLRKRTTGVRNLFLVGSHGAEPAFGNRVVLTPEQVSALDRAVAACEHVARATPGTLVERKPFSVGLHYRGCDAAAEKSLLDSIGQALAGVEGLHRRDGMKVVEFAAVQTDKGHGLIGLAHRTGASATFFMGDDITDEDGFTALGPSDLTVKVGPGDTAAAERVADRRQAVALLELLAHLREEHVRAATPTPIERHSILSDQRTIAVVDPRGSIVWLCLPRADSSAVFARLVGDESRGSFDITPIGDRGEPRQEYASDSWILITAWENVTVTDYFDCTGGRPFQRAGRSDLVRRLDGRGKVLVRFAPRLDFGRMPTVLVRRDGGIEVDGSPDPFVLFSPGVEWKIESEGPHHTAVAEIELKGEPVVLEVRYGFGSLLPARASEDERRLHTERFWTGWARTLRLPSTRPDLVMRSALVLKGLCYGPTGAIYAAATTSLPEQLGGVRNWDYRFCWPRDACLAAAALMKLGNTGTAMKLLDWLVGVVDRCESPDRLHPLYTVAGHELGPEGEVGELRGYANSRPVRVGNAADRQVQLDVFGPIVALAAMLVERGAPVTPEHWRLVEAMVNAVAARWTEPDHGIWEVRGPRAHHTHTKIMCWLAVDRGVYIAENVLGKPRPEWTALRRAIADDVFANGWSERAGAFTFQYGSDALDAATLFIGLTGMLPPDDPRCVSTVRAVQRGLLEGPVVYRYVVDDGLPGVEGGFNIATSWLIESLILMGERDEAEQLFDKMASLAGPTGLLAEQFDPRIGLATGNFPQVYSHLGLINAAVALG